MTLVVDASVVAAALMNVRGGEWARSLLLTEGIHAPHFMPAEVASSLRRAALGGTISQDAATRAYADLLDLRVELYPYEPLAQRIWELRGNITAYDAWYVALAEMLDVRLATLDRRLAAAAGPRCTFAIPPA